MEQIQLDLEVRSTEGNKVQLSLPVNQPSKLLMDKNGRQFREYIPREVWEQSLTNLDELKVLYNHKDYINFGKVDNVSINDKELIIDVTLSDNAEGVRSAIEQRKLNSVSFGFQALEDTFDKVGNYFKRIIKSMKVFEFSLLDITSAYNNTSIEVRSMVEVPNDLIDEEKRKIQKAKLQIARLRSM